MKNENVSNSENPYILVVDDIGANLKLLGDILNGGGYHIRPVTDGEMALKVAEKETPGLILLDIMMPGMNGYKVCRQLKENPGLKDVPVIFISALSDSYDIVKALNLGGVDYITKPFQAEEVIARVNTHYKLYQQSLELKKQRKELQELNETKDKFFSIIAHDLRSPLSGFLGLTKIMAEDMRHLPAGEIEEMLGMIHKSAAGLSEMLENLLEWAKIQRGIIDFNPEFYSLKGKISGYMDTVAEVARNKEIIIETNIPDNLGVYADVRMLESVIRNLITNAIKFTFRGGRIIVSARVTEKNDVEICVSDTGMGMTKELSDNLFRLNLKTGRQGTEGEISSGLGLIICNEFIEKHDGKLWVESEVEKGSAFFFTIPNKNPIS